MEQNNNYNTVEEALKDLREGKIILVTDDPDRGRYDLRGGICHTKKY